MTTDDWPRTVKAWRVEAVSPWGCATVLNNGWAATDKAPRQAGAGVGGYGEWSWARERVCACPHGNTAPSFDCRCGIHASLAASSLSSLTRTVADYIADGAPFDCAVRAIVYGIELRDATPKRDSARSSRTASGNPVSRWLASELDDPADTVFGSSMLITGPAFVDVGSGMDPRTSPRLAEIVQQQFGIRTGLLDHAHPHHQPRRLRDDH